MVDEKQIAEWSKYYRQSVRALPVQLGLLVAVALGLFGLSFVVSIPTWVTIIVIGVTVFGTLGDALNILYLGRKLKQARRVEP